MMLLSGTGIYEIIPGFVLSSIVIIVVSLVTKPEQEMLDDMKKDRDFYKEQCDGLRADIAVLNRKVEVLEKELREYRRQTDGTSPTRRRRTTAPKPATAGKEKKEHPS